MHTLNSLFQHEEADAVLLMDASNAFNTINQAAALHNIRVLCPALATRSIEHSQQSLGQLQFEDPQGVTLLHLMSNSQARLSS